MWSSTATRFEDVHERERELNARQRDILALIEKGHTNREIADMLSISVDGAKWNVSEILTKLGLDSREDAAEYWRWRRRKSSALVRTARGLFGLPGMKWVVGSAGAAVVGVAGVSFAFGGEGSNAAPPPEPMGFYVEASIHVADPEYPRDEVLRWWHRDPDHIRWDYDRVSPAIKAQHTTTIVDGPVQSSYSPDGAVIRPATPESIGSRQVRTPSDVVFIGPSWQPNMPALLAELSGWGDGSVAAQVVRYEDVNGIPATVITYLSGTIWLDATEMVVLKHDSDRYRVVLTKLERRVIAPDEVALNATVAARPTPTPRVFVPNQPGGLDFGIPLRPGYLPGGIEVQLGGSSGCTATECYYELICMSQAQMQANQALPGTPLRNGEYVRIEQRLGLREMPADLETGTAIQVRGVSGYLDTSGVNPVLSWQDPDGMIVRLEGSMVGVEELLKVADGLAKQP